MRRLKLDGQMLRRIIGARRRIVLALAAVIILGTGVYLAIAAAAGVDLTRREVPEVERGISAYEAGEHETASKAFEQGRTDIEDEEGGLWLDRGLALARLEKHDEATVAFRRAAGEAKSSKEVRSEAHYALGNLAMSQHRDFEALEEYRQALRLWPENRDAAWNLSLARRRLAIDACKIVGPPTLRVASGQESDEVTGEVVELPRTGEAGALNGLKAQLGVGLDGSDPRDEEGWAWQNAEYSGEAEEGGGERYSAKIKAGPPGRYDYAFRFRQPGGEWAVCDQDGSNVSGYTPDQAGDLWVEPPGNRCQLLGPPWLIAAPGETTAPMEVAVAIAEGAQVEEIEIGFGPDGSDPGSEDWSWSAAEPIEPTIEAAGTIPAGSPRFHGSLTVADEGRYDMAFRLRAGGEEQWIHCDLNGSDDGYAPQGAGDLIVRDLPESGCLLDRPPRTAAGPEQTTEPIRAIVRGTGEQQETFQVEVGVGPDGSNPDDEGWTWTATESAEGAPDGWVAFEIGFEAPGEEGSFDYAARVRQDGGGGSDAGWVTCDLDGSDDGYEPEMAGDLLVQESQGEDQQDQQDEEQDEEQEDEQEEEQEDEQEEQDEQDDQQEEEQEQLPQDMESALDALQQNERTFLPPRAQRQVQQDW